MIYLDNAATTWPKPEDVVDAITDCVKFKGANPGRGGHKMALDAGRVVYETREAVAKLFNIGNPTQVVFTMNATEAINLGIKGLVKKGDHIITSSMEHNAVSRPLRVLADGGLEVSKVECSREGYIKPEDLEKEIKKNTRLVVLAHASNVTGTIMPIKEIGRLCREKGITFMVDAAQTAGFLDINVDSMNIDLLAFPGHKGLYGPQGTGGLYIREGITLKPLKEGGTGSKSESLYQPDFLPDKLESGTPNTPGLAGLRAGIAYIQQLGLDHIRQQENYLMGKLLTGMKNINGLKLYGPCDTEKQVPVVSFNFIGQDASETAYILDQVFEIAARSGLHCAPDAHSTIGTFESGTVRFSLSCFNSEKDIDMALTALNKIAEEI